MLWGQTTWNWLETVLLWIRVEYPSEAVCSTFPDLAFLVLLYVSAFVQQYPDFKTTWGQSSLMALSQRLLLARSTFEGVPSCCLFKGQSDIPGRIDRKLFNRMVIKWV